MRYEYIEPFVATTKRVLTSIIRDEVSSGDIGLVGGQDLSGDVFILIPVRGDSEGCIIVNMTADTARKVCAVMSGTDCGGGSAVELDALAELSNMIVGSATSSLNDLGYDFSVHPPSVIGRADVAAKTGGVELFRVPLGTKLGEISVNVALRMN